ncbi:MAG TPA: hypothetical protein PKJ26_00985 [Candidatus Woesebacteria bacterium]|nr:hypothetical protein [Candidatus Woesebacteria bacterium]HNS65049.1 hypothetical protein [Candidatus Woesebacteria bacterium]
MSKQEKLIQISNWFLFLHIIYKLGVFVGCFVLLWMFSYMIGLNESTSESFSLVGAIIVTTVLLLNNILYWKNSGVYVTKQGDHIVKQGGWFVKEDKLLNGIIIANQVTRNPIDQLLGMASIQTGLFGDKHLTGVRYRDIQSYDDTMRSSMNGTFSSMF